MERNWSGVVTNNTLKLSSSTNNNGICSNCEKFGHFSYQCNYPTVSYGMIVYRRNNETQKREYLMICRKDSFGYVDFIRGKYALSDMDHVRHIIREMSQNEHEKIKEAECFSNLWYDFWNVSITKNTHKHEERMARQKYESLKRGFPHGYGLNENNVSYKQTKEKSVDKMIYLKDMIEESSSFENPEWEFPKGRKELKESEIECALREFEEETGISKLSVRLIENLLGFDENYIGTNYVAYKHRYFLAEYSNEQEEHENEELFMNFQKNEVGKMKWKSLDQCLSDMRPYHLEKKRILKIIDTIIENYLIE